MSEVAHHHPSSDGRRVVAVLLLVLIIELIYRAQQQEQLHGVTALLTRAMEPLLQRYAVARAWTIDHRILAILCGLLAAVVSALMYRAALLIWHNELSTRLSGTHFRQSEHAVPMLKV